ncbi:MAG: PEP-CTERM sorting domain-containing protein [Planctomycetota bacterium]
MLNTKTVALAASALLAATGGRADSILLQSFESDDLTSPFNTELSDQHPGSTRVMGVGNTDGDWALQLTPTPTQTDDGFRIGFSIALSLEAVQALRATNTITWDVTSLEDPDPSDDVTGFGTAFSYNTSLTGFQTSTDFPSTFDTFFIDFVGYGGGTVATGVTVTDTVLDAMEASITGSVSGTPGFAQIFINNLYLNSDLNQLSPTVYIDNVRIQIPEPATLILAGLGIAAAARRQRV